MTSEALGFPKLNPIIGDKKCLNHQFTYVDRNLNHLDYHEESQNNALLTNRNNHRENRELHVPKTFTTRKGPLVLFSEDLSYDHLTEDSSINANKTSRSSMEKPIKTFGDLRRSILEFGANESDDWFQLDIEKTNSKQEVLEKIRPGFSARRYLSNWSRKWKPELLENLAKGGSIKEESLFEPSEFIPNSKQRINDNLSRIPPSYRIQDKWLQINIPALKGYRFYRVESNLSDNKNSSSFINIEQSTESIQIFDKDGNDIQYQKLSKSDQEAVLTELLIQTAIQSITEKRIESFQSTFKRDVLKNQKKAVVKELNPNEILSDWASNSTNQYIFPALNGNKLISKFSYSSRYNRNLNPIEFIVTAKTSSNFLKRETLGKKQDEENIVMNKCHFLNESLFSDKKQTASLDIKLVLENLNGDVHNFNKDLSKKSIHPLGIKLGDTLPNLSTIDSKEIVTEKKDSQIKSQKDKPSGVIVIAPDGEIVQIGKALQEDINNFSKSKNDVNESYHDLHDQISPFLYYSNKTSRKNKSENDELSKESPEKKIIEENNPVKLNCEQNEPVLTKNLLEALVIHAQKIAKKALANTESGLNLIDDIKIALNENYKKLKKAVKTGEMDSKDFEEYTILMKDALKESLTDLCNF